MVLHKLINRPAFFAFYSIFLLFAFSFIMSSAAKAMTQEDLKLRLRVNDFDNKARKAMIFCTGRMEGNTEAILDCIQKRVVQELKDMDISLCDIVFSLSPITNPSSSSREDPAPCCYPDSWQASVSLKE